jgi:hypothetical protein
MALHRSRTWLGTTLCLFGALVFGLSWVIAGTIRQGQRYHDVGAYWLLPTNRTDFYFLPLLAVATLGLTSVAGRANRWGAMAIGLALFFSVSRVLFWGNVAESLPAVPSLTELAVASAAQTPLSIAIGGLGLLAWVALALSILEALRADPQAVVAGTPNGAGQQ